MTREADSGDKKGFRCPGPREREKGVPELGPHLHCMYWVGGGLRNGFVLGPAKAARGPVFDCAGSASGDWAKHELLFL